MWKTAFKCILRPIRCWWLIEKEFAFLLYVATMNTKLNASEKNDRFLFRQQKVAEKVFLQYVPYRRAKARGTSQKQHSFLFLFFLLSRICHLSRSLQSWNFSARVVTIMRLSEQTHISAITPQFVWPGHLNHSKNDFNRHVLPSASLVKEDIAMQCSLHFHNDKQCDNSKPYYK